MIESGNKIINSFIDEKELIKRNQNKISQRSEFAIGKK